MHTGLTFTALLEASTKILMDNGTEFKNQQTDNLCRELDINRVYSPVYTPEANGRLEAWHHFFKPCVVKHIRGNAAEWDEVFPLAAAAYNFSDAKLQENHHLYLCSAETPSPLLQSCWNQPQGIGVGAT